MADEIKSTNPPTGNPGKGSTPNTAVTGASTTSKPEADMKAEAKAAATEAHSRAAAATDELKDEASKLSEQAKRRAEMKAREAQEAGAQQVQSLAQRMRAAGEEFGAGSLPDRYVGQMADSLSSAANAFASKDPGALIGDVAAFARRNPTAFIGGAALLGFAIARFAKASSPQPAQYGYADDFDRPMAARDTAPDWSQGRPMAAPAVHAPEK